MSRTLPVVFRAALALPLLLALGVSLLGPSPGVAKGPNTPPVVIVDIPAATQGPLWPPSEVTNEAGDFLTVGILLHEIPGRIFALPELGAAALVSKDTAPPLDANGNKINNNWFLAGYDIIRRLDLSPGSPDLDMVLYNLSMGPPEDGGNIPRVPRVGDSAFNLYTDEYPCQELFPSDSQRQTYSRPRFPLHEIPIWGYQGDQIALDVNTGDPFDPFGTGGPGCGTGCSGEDLLDDRAIDRPITLGDWLGGTARVKIQLEDFDEVVGGYTAAEFDFRLENALPNSMYSIWTIRPRRIPGSDFAPQADPLSIHNVILTDENGDGRGIFHVRHPFQDPDNDPKGLRIEGVVIAWHPDFQNWGACGALMGAGIDLMTAFNSLSRGNLDFTPFITVPPSE